MLLLYDAITSVYTHVISLHIHVLTCVNVPIKLGHMTTQNKCCYADSYIINHSFIYACIS